MDISFLKHIKLISLLIVATIFTACNPDLEYSVRGYTQKIIVDGSIETGKQPVVYLSLNVPLWKTLDSASMLDHVIRYAKVTITDGEKTEILTSKWDRSHFPPYSYNATELIGEEGKTYQLKVEYGGYTVYGTTLLPVGTAVKNIETLPSSVSDTLKTVMITLNINKQDKTGFKVYTKKPCDKRYIETPIIFNADLSLSGLQKFNLSPVPEQSDSSYHQGKYFAVGDTIDIKVCALDSTSTKFFNGLSLYSSIAGNIFTSEVKALKSNISEPGFGIWYGKGVRYYKYVIK